MYEIDIIEQYKACYPCHYQQLCYSCNFISELDMSVLSTHCSSRLANILLSRNHTSDCRLAIGDWRLLFNQSEWSSLQMLCSNWLESNRQSPIANRQSL